MGYRFKEQLLVFIPPYGGILPIIARIFSTIDTSDARTFPTFAKKNINHTAVWHIIFNPLIESIRNYNEFYKALKHAREQMLIIFSAI